MRLLLFLLGAAIVYGSLFPLRFRGTAIAADEIAAFLGSWRDSQSAADMTANIGLFVPYGLLVALIARGRPHAVARLLLHALFASAFAVALQAVQLWIPVRVASLRDVISNMIGFMAGAGLAQIPWRRLIPQRHGWRFDAVPLVLVGCWLAFRLFPYRPALSQRDLTDNLDRLLTVEQIAPTAILRDAMAWLIIAQALRHMAGSARAGWLPPALIAAVFGLELLIADNGLTANALAGAALALALWFAVLKHAARPQAVLAGAMIATLVVRGLAPFQLWSIPSAFHWLPFQGYFYGSVGHGFMTLLEKCFLYGSALWLLQGAGLRALHSAAALTAIAAGIEYAQTYFRFHTAELSDPLLVAVLAVVFAALAARQRQTDSLPQWPIVDTYIAGEAMKEARQ